MEKMDILELFLKNGVMLSPEEFETIDEKNYMHILEEKRGASSKDDIIVSKPRTGRISCDQFVRASVNKFEFLRGIILKKTEAVSINKAKKVFSEVTIIGRVKETSQRGFIIEDVTGEAEVVYENMDISVGDVIGMKGYFKENSFFPSQVVWPDIPLDNVPKPLGIRMTLTTKVKDGRMPGLIVCPDSEKACNVVTGFGRAGSVNITKHGSSLLLTAYSKDAEIKEEDAVKILKKRSLPVDGPVENVMEEIPHIIWFFDNKRNWVKNYRGVIIISTDSESFADYDGQEVGFGKL
ncbi:MAG: hypothetical protein NTU57_03960 [Candidatus Aenigmarchaeota archaeon]|nr:hypothetical protein [Candidatus Aenigmarchaeota archaeon]